MSASKCGGCTACCLAVGVIITVDGRLTVFSEEGKWCKYCDRNRKCGIYPQHPKACQKFQCLWLMLGWPIGMRPDRVGFLFYIDEGALWISECQQGEVDVPVINGVIKNLNGMGIMVGVKYLSGLCKIYKPGEEVFCITITPELTRALLPIIQLQDARRAQQAREHRGERINSGVTNKGDADNG